MSEEKSLEDFFAKKDKSKKSKKSKTKFAKSTTEEIAKRLTEADLKKERKEKESQKEKPPPPKETDDKEDKPKDIIGDEDDWRDNEEKEKDYSGLKIQLQISANPDQDEEEEEEDELDEFGEPIKNKGSAHSGPWNKLEHDPDQETETVAQPPPPKPVEVVVASTKVVGGKYVPPGKRGGDSGSTPTGPSSRSYKKKSAPQINNEQEFPSLAASSDLAKHTDKNSDKNFEKVTRGGPSIPNHGGQGPKLDLGNRYAALEQN
ncbi:protein CDV3 homolog [Asterias amurensis]|uniref:protein CDV3 homolog n=1 Tax=Asterias amurensis TaxID=7602 RepID=UPI003AB3D25F